ncbi:MAG: chromosomal replication initiator protein DnaA [Acidimicrobiales bacterium]
MSTDSETAAVASELWARCCGSLRAELPDGVWLAWLDPVRPRSLVSGRLVLEVPSVMAKERIEARYRTLITDVVREVTGDGIEIEVVVETGPPSQIFQYEVEPGLGSAGRHAGGGAPAGGAGDGQGVAGGPWAQVADAGGPSGLNPAFTFDRFVVGDSNGFARAAALSVAEKPGRSWNPLFITGRTGLGKTHLLHAIGQYVRETDPNKLVIYTSTESFLSNFIDAIRSNAMPAFKNRYRQCDVLLVDDVQLIEGKERFQQEFFHTFDYLRAAGRQVVFTSDRPPNALATLEERLRSRFNQGLITDVFPPDLETRVAILGKKAENEPISVPDEVLEYIATVITDNIRELEGALNQVLAHASLYRLPLDRSLAEVVLADLVASGQPRPITPRAVLDATADMFGLTVEDLCGKSRSRPLVAARQIAMYVLRTTTPFSYPAIGKVFGNRDHTTVMHAVSKIEGRMRERKVIYNQVNELTSRLRTGGQPGGNG